MKRSGFKFKPRKPLRRTALRVKGHSTTTELKDEIQAVLRETAIIRDGGCVLRHYKEAGKCGSYRKDGQLILQAEHLHTRSNNGSFGDMRNIVCICRNHHIFFKKQHGDVYWDLIRIHIGEDRWAYLRALRSDYKSHKMDLKLLLIVLKQDLEELKK